MVKIKRKTHDWRYADIVICAQLLSQQVQVAARQPGSFVRNFLNVIIDSWMPRSSWRLALIMLLYCRPCQRRKSQLILGSSLSIIQILMWQSDIFAQRCICQNFCPSIFLTPRFSLRRDKSFVLFRGPSNRRNEWRAQTFATSGVMLLVLRRPLVLCLKLIILYHIDSMHLARAAACICRVLSKQFVYLSQ